MLIAKGMPCLDDLDALCMEDFLQKIKTTGTTRVRAVLKQNVNEL